MRKDMISGFADEAAKDFATQLETVRGLGMKYLCLRGIDGRSIVDFTEEEARGYLKPMLDRYGLSVSSLGSPIGKITVTDEEAFERQCRELDTLCRIARVLGTRYIRLFSFYPPEGESVEPYYDAVVAKMRRFVAICAQYGVTPMHENEKGIFGDTGARCVRLMRAMADEGLVCAYDFANFVQGDEDTVACYEMLAPWIRYVHVKDARYADHTVVLAGTGDGHLPEILRALKDSGYDGFLTIEPHLRVFDGLKALESTVQEQTVADGVYRDGIAAFTAQYRALCGLLDRIGVQ